MDAMEDIKLGEVSWTQKNKYCKFSLTVGAKILKRNKKESKKKETHVDPRIAANKSFVKVCFIPLSS